MGARRLLRQVHECPFRSALHGSDSEQVATCSLLQQISGVTNHRLCTVRRDACDACCETFLPKADLINPVLASLLWNLADTVIGRRGVPGCSSAKARQLQDWADKNLEVAFTHDRRTFVPDRITRACCYLGEPIATARQPDSVENERDTTFVCRHPRHRQTTVERCRLCRDWSDLPGLVAVDLDDILPLPAKRRGPRVRRWSVGVTTAPRHLPTLEWCLDSLGRAGWEKPRLFVDSGGEVPERYAGLPVTLRDSKLGAWPNFFLALAELLMRDPDADAFMLVQDDAHFYDRQNLREYLERALWPADSVGFVSLFCSAAYARPEPGWYRHDGAWVWGALAFIFPRRAAKSLVADREVLEHRWDAAGRGLTHVDVVVGRWAERHRQPVYFPSPSLVQHTGETSTLWPTARAMGMRRADQFAGDRGFSLALDPALSRFDEEEFPCPGPARAAYQRTVAAGYRRMKSRSVVICGLARDVLQFLPDTSARIEALAELFARYHVVIYENDSMDDTLLFLRAWSRRNPRVQILNETCGASKFGQVRNLQRTKLLASFRNKCKQFAVQSYPDADFLIMLDTDLRGGWSYDGIAHTFGHTDWDFVGSNGIQWQAAPHGSGMQRRAIHFDTFAFRRIGQLKARPDHEDNRLQFFRGEPLVPVWFCFGGLGVYRMQAIRSCRYDGSDCEHIGLHRMMRLSGADRLFLNPSQIVCYGGVGSLGVGRTESRVDGTEEMAPVRNAHRT